MQDEMEPMSDTEQPISICSHLALDADEYHVWFPGPETRRPRAWPPKKLAPSLFFDQHLFSVDDKRGTSVWDVTSGEQLHEDQTLKPIHYHPRSREFLSVVEREIRLSQLIE